MKILVIGYGNRSRSDDGVGWFVIEQLEKQKLPGVELPATHQLDIDLAETISRYDTVIFVDASAREGVSTISREVVRPKLQGHAVAHYLMHGDLLAMAGAVYGAAPAGILFSIPARALNFGAELSPQTQMDAQSVVTEITRLILLLQTPARPLDAGRTCRHA